MPVSKVYKSILKKNEEAALNVVVVCVPRQIGVFCEKFFSMFLGNLLECSKSDKYTNFQKIWLKNDLSYVIFWIFGLEYALTRNRQNRDKKSRLVCLAKNFPQFFFSIV